MLVFSKNVILKYFYAFRNLSDFLLNIYREK